MALKIKEGKAGKNIYIEESLINKTNEFAQSKKRSFSEITAIALEAYLKKEGVKTK